MTARFGLHPQTLGTEAIARFTRHLVEVAGPDQLGLAVPTCGDWTVADLVWHLAEVQAFWAWIIENRPAPAGDAVVPDRAEPAASRAQLVGANDRLCAALGAAPFDDPTWTWHPDHRTVDFSIRRQTHEALIHCFDAVLASDGPAPAVEPLLAADGFDELVTVMAGGAPDWADYVAGNRRVDVHAVDTGDRWLLEFGTITGRSPGGTEYRDEPTMVVVHPDDGPAPAAEIRGAAVDLNLWAWGRGPEETLTIDGDQGAVTGLRRLIEELTQ